MLLPIAPFTETSGTFVNAEGRAKASSASSCRWAIPARRGRCCACSATCSTSPASPSQDTPEAVRAEFFLCLPDLASLLDKTRPPVAVGAPRRAGSRRHCSALPTCRSTRPTLIVRRAALAANDRRRALALVHAPSMLAAERGIVDGARCASLKTALRSCCPRASMPRWRRTCCVCRPAHPLTAALGPMFGALQLALEPEAQTSGVATTSAA